MNVRKTTPCSMHAIASMALGLLLVAAFAPAIAHADETSESDSLTARFDRLIDPGIPDGYSDDVANPYGKALGEKFLFSEQNELLLYYSFDTNGNKKNQHANWYDTFTAGGGTSLTKNNGFASSDSYPDTKAYNYVQAIGFDPNGSGRKDHVAYLGYERTGNKNDKGYYVLWVVDAVSGNQSSVLRVRSAADASCNWLDEHNADLYSGNNFFNIVAGDIDNDGVLASYAGSGYAWSDPQVRAILQASPFFSELNDAENGMRYASGGCETRYSTKTMYSYETSSSNSVSYGVGVTGEAKWFSGRIGYAGSWTRTFMNSVETEVSNTFTAGATDTIVLCRTPVFMYNYDLSYRDENDQPATSTYQMTFPKAPVFEQMTLQRYNEFVPYYNSTIEAAAKKKGIDEATYREAFLQNVGDNLYLGHEGNPYGYYQADRSDNPGPTPQTKFGDSVGLSTNASATSINYSYTETEASSREVANGFSFDASVMGGFSIGGVAAKAGVYISLEYMRGHSTTTTNGTGTSFGGTVMGFDGTTMEADGLDPDAWSFKWRLATWDSNLKTGKLDGAGFVPIVGYALNNVEAPAAAVNNLDIRFTREANSDALRFDLLWDCGDTVGSKRPKTVGYCVYLYDNARETYLLLGKIADAQTTAYTYETAFDGRGRYTFKVASCAEATSTAASEAASQEGNANGAANDSNQNNAAGASAKGETGKFDKGAPQDETPIAPDAQQTPNDASQDQRQMSAAHIALTVFLTALALAALGFALNTVRAARRAKQPGIPTNSGNDTLQ